MSLLFKGLLAQAVFLLACTNVFGQVVINEYSASNRAGLTDQFGDNPDWVELYNTGGATVDLSGYYLSDNENNPTKWIMPAGTSIPANGYLLIYCTKRDMTGGGEVHTSFTLKQCKPEEIVLADAGGTVIDLLGMDTMRTMAEHSRGRFSDGANTWSLFSNPTPGAQNTGGIPNYAATPVYDQVGGYYGGAVTVNITSPDGSDVYYTTDGSEPTTGSTQVTGPVTVPNTQVLRARAFSPVAGTPPSFTETNTYFVGITHTVPIVSICGDQVDDLLTGTQLDPIGSLEYFDENGILIDKAVGHFNKHGNDSWAYDQRGFDYITRDEFGYNDDINGQLFPTKSRTSFERLIIKAAANDNYPFETGAHIRDSYIHHMSQLGKLKMDERSWAPCILYMNGQYWGVYDTREKVDDHDFTDYYYDQDKFNLDFIKTWGGTWTEYGDMNHWNDLYTFITTNDMSIQTNFDYMDSLYNWKSLVDYVVLGSYTVCADWLNWNTAWWHGHNPDGDKKKFRYVLWDVDASFGHYVNYTGIPDQSANADPCDPEGLSGSSDPEGHITILNKLMENPQFEQYYIARYADLSNTTFKCDNMIALLDSMIAVIEPEMQAQINRWGGTYQGWQDEVTELKDFINDRCAALTQGMIDCYTLTGPYDITVDVDPPLSGDVRVNSVTPNLYTWSGTYYGGMETLLRAQANTGYVFDYWELDNHTVGPAIDTTHVSFTLDTTENIIAHFRLEGTPPSDPILEDYLIEIPNAFSPNGDGQNDELQIFASDIEEFEMTIYSRWGEKVWESDSHTKTWDGTFNGTQLGSGVYAYKLYVKFTDDSEVLRGGNITLMR